MDKDNFKGGFSVRSDDPNNYLFGTEWLFDDRVTDPNKLQFMAYDLNLYPAPDFDTWSDEDYKKKNIRIALQVTKDFPGSVWLDDTKIK